MSQGECFRRWITASCNVAALTIILLCIAPELGVVEVNVVACFVAWKLCVELVVWLGVRDWRKGRHGKISCGTAPATAAATCFLVLCFCPRPRDVHVDARADETNDAFTRRLSLEIVR